MPPKINPGYGPAVSLFVQIHQLSFTPRSYTSQWQEDKSIVKSKGWKNMKNRFQTEHAEDREIRQCRPQHYSIFLFQWFLQRHFITWNRRYKRKKKLISKISVVSNFTFLSYSWLCVFHCSHRHDRLLSQQYSTNENPSLSRSNFLANLMHGHSDSSWSGSSLPEITEQRIFHVLFYCEQIRLKCIINCIYPSWLNF